jgi:hypothetical protein
MLQKMEQLQESMVGTFRQLVFLKNWNKIQKALLKSEQHFIFFNRVSLTYYWKNKTFFIKTFGATEVYPYFHFSLTKIKHNCGEQSPANLQNFFVFLNNLRATYAGHSSSS